jgi:hypothetical protein
MNMKKKTPIRFHLKKIIDSLRQGKKTYSELKKLEIPEKSLDRALMEYLQYWGLAEKIDGYWTWYEYSTIFKSKFDYNSTMNHSKILLQRFHTLVHNPDKHSQDEEYVAMKEHLKSYPDTYSKLEEYEKVFTKMNHRLMQNKKVLSKFYHRPLDPFAFKEDLNKFKPTTPEEEKLKDELEKDFDRFWEIYIPLKSDLNSLETKFLHGQPLEGKCSLCSKVKIIEENSKQNKRGNEQ